MIILFLRSSASTHVNKSESVPTIKHSLRRNAEHNSAQTEVVIQSGDFTSPKDFNKSKHENKIRVQRVLLKKNQQQLYDKRRSASKINKGKFDSALQVVKRKLDFEPHLGLYEEEVFVDHFSSEDSILPSYSQWLYNNYLYYLNLCSCLPQVVIKDLISHEVCDSFNSIKTYFNQDKFITSRDLIKSFHNRLSNLKTLFYCRNYLSTQNLLDMHLDSWLVFVTGLLSSTNMTNVASIIYLFVKERNLLDYWPYIKNLFKEFNFKIKIQSSVDDIELDESQADCSHADFITFIRGKFKSIKHMANCKAFKLCSKLFSMLISNFLCSSLFLKFSVCGFKVFNESFMKKIFNTNIVVTDIFDLIMESMEYFLDIGYLCFKYKSFRPLLFDNHEQMLMAELHVKFVSSWNAVKELDWINSGFQDEVQYREDAVKLIDFYKSQFSSLKSLNTHEAEIVKRKWEFIETKLQEMVRLSMCGRLRKSPFALCIHGGSSVGKSSISQILTTSAIIAQGGNPSPEYATVYNPNDNFFSTYKYGTEAILLDDMCNTKPDFVKNSPVEKIIEFVNNIASYPVMADLASKGKIPLEPKVVTVTTNVEDLLAGVYSMEPVSILRRFNLFLTVQVKKQFAKNPDSAPQHFQLCPSLAREYSATLEHGDPLDMIFADYWDIYCYTIESGGSSGKATVVKKPVIQDDEGFAIPMSIKQVHELVCSMAHRHVKDQQLVVKRISDLPKTLSDAYKDIFPHNRSSYDDMKQQSGLSLITNVNEEGINLTNIFSFKIFSVIVGIFPIIFCFRYLVVFLSFLIYLIGLSLKCYSIYVRNQRIIQYSVRNPRTSIIAISALSVGFTCIVFQTFKTMLRMCISFFREKMHFQGNLMPLSVEELNLNSTKENIWVQNNITPISVEGCKTMVDYQLINKVEKNLCIATINSYDEPNKFNYVNVLFVKTNFAIIPNHFFEIMCRRNVEFINLRSSRTEGVQDRVTKVRFNRNIYYNIPGTDLGILYLTYGVPMADLCKFFTNVYPERSLPAEMAYLNSDGYKMRASSRLDYGIQTTEGVKDIKGSSYPGYRYILNNNICTFSGMCMGTWISNTKPTCIVGFHLGGATGTPHGCAGYLSKTQLDDALCVLTNRNIDVVHVASEGVFNPHFGKTHDKNKFEEIKIYTRPDHPINFIDDSSAIVNFGVIGDTHKYRTKVEKRKYADLLFAKLGVDIKHGPPNMNIPPKWYHFSKNLFKFAEPGIGPSSVILQLAVQDYMLPIIKELVLFNNTGKLMCRPLTNTEIINGINGMRFVDGVKMNSSIGFPLAGKMVDFVKGPDNNKDFNEESIFFWDRVSEMERLYFEGKRAYPVFTAHLKDEPKKIGSDKVRVFFGASTDFKLILRKYYLPIVRLLSEIPLLSECAVGIDSHSSSWQELMQHVSAHGESNIVAGDYSGYDQQLPLNVTQASMKILVVIAKHMGYDNKSLKIMESMIADITTPMVNYYGSLLMLMGGNPSGQNLTVYLNSIVNSVLSRCAFFELRPDSSFCYYRKYVSQITYGDDDIGSVSERCPWFNSISKARVLQNYGLIYTPPSKTGDHVNYMSLDEVDFLKRKNVYIPDIQRQIGALDEDSIMKSLSYGIKSVHVTDEELIGQVIDGALHEYFAHGRHKYEKFRNSIIEFLNEHNLNRYSLTYNLDFDSRIERWREAYGAQV